MKHASCGPTLKVRVIPPPPRVIRFMLSRLLANAGSSCLHFQEVACFSVVVRSPLTPTLGQTPASDLVSLFMVLFTQRSLIVLGWGLCLGTEQQSGDSPNTSTSQKGLATTETAGDEEGDCHTYPIVHFLLKGGRNMSIFQLWKQAYRRSSNLARVTIIISSMWV